MKNINDYAGYIGLAIAGIGFGLVAESIGACLLLIGGGLAIARCVRWFKENE